MGVFFYLGGTTGRDVLVPWLRVIVDRGAGSGSM